MRSYKVSFHPVPQQRSNLRALHHGVSSLLREPERYFAASSGFVLLYTVRFKEKEKRAAVVANATVQKQGSVQRFKFAGRLEFSVGQWVI